MSKLAFYFFYSDCILLVLSTWTNKSKVVFTTSRGQSTTNWVNRQEIWLKACYSVMQSKDSQSKQHLLTNGFSDE